MKHLANCAPTEFMAQAIKLREPLARWLEATGAASLRERYVDPSPDRRGRAAFLGELQRAAMEKCPELTRELLALLTFTEPTDFESRPMAAYLRAAYEVYSEGAVRDFFTLLCAPTTRRSTGA